MSGSFPYSKNSIATTTAAMLLMLFCAIVSGGANAPPPTSIATTIASTVSADTTNTTTDESAAVATAAGPDAKAAAKTLGLLPPPPPPLPRQEATSRHLPLSDPDNKGNWTPYPAMSDEFEGGVGGNNLNTSKWGPSPGWRGRQPGLFDNARNVIVANGTLQLWARAAHRNASWPTGYDNYTTAAIHSRAKTAHGYFEIRSRSGNSCISSSWWLHDNDGRGTWTEIDVFETNGAARGMPGCAPPSKPPQPPHNRLVPSHQHIFALRGLNATQVAAKCACKVANQGPQQSVCSSAAYYTSAQPVSADFHVYGLLWNATHLTFYVDGNVTGYLATPCLQQPIGMDFDRETMPGWMDMPRPDLLPDRPFEVDYVRVWKQQGHF